MKWIARILTLPIVTVSWLMLPISSHADEIQDLKLRLEHLEKENTDIKQQHHAFKKEITKNLDAGVLAQDLALDLETQMRSSMKISGYADVEYKNSTEKGKEPGFRIHHFSLFFTKHIADKWQLFSEIEYEDGPNFEGSNTTHEVPAPTTTDPNNTETVSELDSATGKIFLEAMNIDFRWKPQASFRFGRFFTPAGIWSVDHYPPFVTTQERPMHIRQVFPQLVDGALAFGRVKMGSTFLKYDLFSGNGEGNTASKDKNSEKSLGLKLALELPILNHVELGVTHYEDTLNDETEKTATGYHLKLQWQGLEFQWEVASADYTPKTDPVYYKEGYYTQLGYRMGNFLVGVRKDVFDDYTGTSQYLTKKDSVYFNHRISKDVVFKLEHHAVKPETDEEYKLVIASIAVNLGN